jgi:hypothetical protein
MTSRGSVQIRVEPEGGWVYLVQVEMEGYRRTMETSGLWDGTAYA